MRRAERVQGLLAGLGEPHANDPPVVAVDVPLHDACRFGAIDQLDDAVVPQQQVAGDVRHAGGPAVPANGEEHLVLRRRDAGPARLVVAPPEEPTEAVAELEEPFEVGIVERSAAMDGRGFCAGWLHIVERSYRGAMDQPQTPRRLALLSLIAAGLGLAGGGAAWVLLHLIDLITNVALFGQWGFDPPSFATLDPSPRIVVVAVIGALAISALARWAPIIRGHGIPEAMEAVLTKESRIAPRTAIAKPLSAAIAIGSSAPFGAEGPIIVTGGAIGSLTGQVLRVSPSERKILLASGAAAGMAATFGAPLAAVVLAVELLLFEFSTRALVPLVVATSVAGGVHAALYSAGPLFEVPHHSYAGLGALPAFALLGLAAGALGVLVTRGLFAVEDLYRRLPVSDFWHPAIGAVAFSLVGLLEPRALGVGYDAIDDVLNGRLALSAVAVLGAVKLASWWLALGSGTSGGTLAPMLLISAATGSLVGAGLNEILPGADVPVSAFAVVAMAATFGAATRATFTAIVFVFELTGDYQAILPLMLATVVADLVFSSLSDDSIMTEKLTRRGLRVGRHYGVDPMSTATIDSIMTTEVVTMRGDLGVTQARERFLAAGHGAYPVVDADGAVVGMIGRRELLGDVDEPGVTVRDLATSDVVSVAPAHHAIDALRLMVQEHVEHVPVLEDGRLVGMCTRTDLLKVRRRQHALERPQPGLFDARPDVR